MFKTLVFSSLLFGCCCYTPLLAQVTLDGSLGPSGPLPGPDYHIGANLGSQYGGNLFHSFRDFNLQCHESATFSGPEMVQNVISRVTGGNPSNINGTIRSTIPNANLYFLNPYGIMFGPNAKLDVQGSFHASTADTLRLQDGGQFNARVPSNSLLTVAPPSAFGFVSDSSTPLTIDHSKLSVPTSQSFSIVGGDLRINQALITAPSGRINLASVAGQGELTLQPQDLVLSGESGNISLSHSQVTTTGARVGDIYIRAGQFEINESSIDTDTTAEGGGMGIDVIAKEMNVTQGGQLVSRTSGTGPAGKVKIKADRLLFSGENSEGRNSGIITDSLATHSGNAGVIEIQASELTLKEGAWITAGTLGTGQGGNITIQVTGPVTLSGENSAKTGEFKGSVIGTYTFGKGAGGILVLNAKQLSLADGAQIGSATFGPGQGGETHLQVSEAVTLSGENSNGVTSGIIADAKSDQDHAGNAGLIELQAGQLTLQSGARVTAATFGTGQGGQVTIRVPGTITLAGEGSAKNPLGDEFKTSVIGAYTTSQGNAGKLELTAAQLSLAAGAQIGTATFGQGQGGELHINVSGEVTVSGENSKGVPSRIIADARGSSGNAGLIELQAGGLTLKEGAWVTAGTWGTGQGGNITIHVAGPVTLSGESHSRSGEFKGSVIGTYTFGKGAGGILVLDAKQLSLTDGAQIGSATFGPGQGGETHLQVSEAVTLSGENSNGVTSGIIADAKSDQDHAGNAGLIELQAGQLTLQGGARVTAATFGTGRGGQVTIRVPGTITLAGEGSDKNPLGDEFKSSVIGSYTKAKGDAGDVELTAGQLSLLDGAKIGTATFSEGQGGITRITVSGPLTLVGKNSKGMASTITAFSRNGTGKAGEIIVQANTINLTKEGSIATSTANADGGNIIIITPNLLYLQNGQVTTSVKGGTGDGGNITINSPVFVILATAQIVAQAEEGHGGNITIQANQFVSTPTPDSLVSASSKKGVSGQVVITSPENNLSGKLLVLSTHLLEARAQLSKSCGATSYEEFVQRGQLVVMSLAGSPPSPYDIFPSSSTKSSTKGTLTTTHIGHSTPTQSSWQPAVVLIACPKRPAAKATKGG